jgi:hypothetical protein
LRLRVQAFLLITLSEVFTIGAWKTLKDYLLTAWALTPMNQDTFIAYTFQCGWEKLQVMPQFLHLKNNASKK